MAVLSRRQRSKANVANKISQHPRFERFVAYIFMYGVIFGAILCGVAMTIGIKVTGR